MYNYFTDNIQYKNSSSITNIGINKKNKYDINNIVSVATRLKPLDRPKIKGFRGERRIREYLIKNKINFMEQYSFNKSSIKRLRFDFAIFGIKSFSNNERVKVLIEFDGEQHFRPIKYWGGEEGYLKQRKRDMLKNNYCKYSEIILIRIPFFQYEKIEEILNKRLLKILSEAN